ncbi:MAG: DUF4272 domain-containing protein [Thermomicrobiales bacterium]
MDEDELDIELRSPADVAQRCIILAALIRRLSIETSASSTHDVELDGDAFDLKAWLQTEGIWDRLTAFEADFLRRPVGQLSEDEIATVAWQAEGLATLGWSLGLVDALPPGELGDAARVLHVVPAPWDQTRQWLRGVALRSEPDVADERDRAEIFEWRIGLEGPRRVASVPLQREYAQAIADVAQEAIAAGLIEGAGDDDLTIGDRLLASFDDQELERLSAIAEERLRALNWLCGFGDAWDRVPLDV